MKLSKCVNTPPNADFTINWFLSPDISISRKIILCWFLFESKFKIPMPCVAIIPKKSVLPFWKVQKYHGHIAYITLVLIPPFLFQEGTFSQWDYKTIRYFSKERWCQKVFWKVLPNIFCKKSYKKFPSIQLLKKIYFPSLFREIVTFNKVSPAKNWYSSFC